MKNLPLIKWHAQELHRLLLQYPNEALTVQIAVELETVFLNSVPFKNIVAKAPEK
jgi:hypothetical protein